MNREKMLLEISRIRNDYGNLWEHEFKKVEYYEDLSNANLIKELSDLTNTIGVPYREIKKGAYDDYVDNCNRELNKTPTTDMNDDGINHFVIYGCETTYEDVYEQIKYNRNEYCNRMGIAHKDVANIYLISSTEDYCHKFNNRPTPVPHTNMKCGEMNNTIPMYVGSEVGNIIRGLKHVNYDSYNKVKHEFSAMRAEYSSPENYQCEKTGGLRFLMPENNGNGLKSFTYTNDGEIIDTKEKGLIICKTDGHREYLMDPSVVRPTFKNGINIFIDEHHRGEIFILTIVFIKSDNNMEKIIESQWIKDLNPRFNDKM